MWAFLLLIGVVALIAAVWQASLRTRASRTVVSEGTDTCFAGEGTSGSDYAAPDCMDSTSDGGSCDGGGDGGGD